jgi:hypothetical protein
MVDARPGATGRTVRRRGRLVAALVVVVALAAAACGNSGDDDSASKATPSGGSGTETGASNRDVPGVTSDKISYAVFGTRSNNPTGACILDCYVDGVKAYFAFRNHDGGIYGRKLTLATPLDDELSKNQEVALQIVSANDTFGAFSATQLASGWGDVAKAGIPLYVWGIHATEMNGHDSIFANNGVICGQCTGRAAPYAGTLVHAEKVATLGYGVTQPSKDCVAAQSRSIEKYADDTGQELAYSNDDLAFGLPNGIAPQVTAMKQAGVDFISTCMDLNGMKTLAEELRRQGMGDVPMLHPNSYDQNFVAEAGDLFEGDLVGVGFRPFEADPGDSGLADYLDWMDRTGAQLSEVAMVGWIDADLAYQGLKAAGKDFDRASVIKATNEITDYSAGGLIDPIDWSRQHEAATDDDPAAHGYAKECIALVKVHDGKFKVVGDKAKPWECWDNDDKAWTDPTPTDFH